jgi:hypothetical protein
MIQVSVYVPADFLSIAWAAHEKDPEIGIVYFTEIQI